MSDELKAKLSQAKKGKPAWNKGLPMPWNNGKKFIKGESPWNKGLHINLNPNGNFKKGVTSWNKGKKAPWTTQRNLERNHLMVGEKAYHWKGGLTTRERKILMSRKPYLQWRISVLDRDEWTCQNCLTKEGQLHAHHIKPWALYKDLRYDVNNGVTLCRSCHELLHLKNK